LIDALSGGAKLGKSEHGKGLTSSFHRLPAPL
jgi:hypothetical protein